MLRFALRRIGLALITLLILVAIIFEEQDLGDALGDEYKAYRARTPMFIPKIKAEVAPSATVVESRA